MIHPDIMGAVKIFSQLSTPHNAVAEINSTAAACEDVIDMVSLGCGDDLAWQVVGTLGHWWLPNTKHQVALRNCEIFADDDHHGNANLMGSG